MTPQILLYNITNEEQKKVIRRLVLRLKIRARLVEKAQYDDPIGTLAGMRIEPPASVIPGADPVSPGDTTDFQDEMLVFCFVPDGLLNQFLLGLRKAGISIPLKAVLTPSNCSWNSYMLHGEISAEHEKMHAPRDAQ